MSKVVATCSSGLPPPRAREKAPGKKQNKKLLTPPLYLAKTTQKLSRSLQGALKILPNKIRELTTELNSGGSATHHHETQELLHLNSVQLRLQTLRILRTSFASNSTKTSRFLLLLVRHLLLVAMHLLLVANIVSTSFLLLVVRHLLLEAMPFAPFVASCYHCVKLVKSNWTTTLQPQNCLHP